MATPLRVLIVEDNPRDAALLVRELERGGYELTIERVDTGEAMVAAIEKQTWDVVVSDYAMPRFSAQAALAVVKKAGVDLPFIIVSGTVGEETAVEAMRAGAHDFMPKDRFARLLPAIARELREAAGRQERRAVERQLLQAQKMELVGQLTGGVAHDFNNLLTVILGNAELMSERLSADPGARENAEMIVTAAQRAAELTRRLLAFSRKQPLKPVSVDVNKLVADLGRLLRRALGENVEIENVLAGGLWKTLADPAQIESALLNLAINSRDAMPQGGKLTIETANTRLDDDYAAAHAEVTPGQYVLLAVSDTGTGMSEDVLARAFEPFFTTKEVGKGSGLGLSMVYGLVKQSGGHIKIYSEPGHGTTVKIYLPRYDEPPVNASAAQKTTEPIPRGSEHVLVVEDNDLVRNHVVALIRSFGYEASEASNAGEALTLLEHGPRVDLMFTDMIMPGEMNGRQLSDAARQMWPALRVVFTSGYAQNALTHQGRLDPNILLLSKPFSKGELARIIRRAFDRAQ